MTSRREGPTTWARAMLSRGEDAVRWALVNDPRRARTKRDAAFRDYLRTVRATLQREPATFTVTGSRMLAEGTESEVVEVSLRADIPVVAGDQLLLWWRNAPAAVDRLDVNLSGSDAYWSTPVPHVPSRQLRDSRASIAASVIDLSEPPLAASFQEILTTSPRITPRFFTVAGTDADIALHVTYADAWPSRASAFLRRATAGEEVRGWVLPHPHRVDHSGPGLAVATGSGAAGVFAALRAGARGIHLVWGVGDKELAPWVQDELSAHLDSGALAQLYAARRPQRVTDLLTPDLVREVAATGWVYVSGNESMGVEVDVRLTEILGAAWRQRAHDELRYIVST